MRLGLFVLEAVPVTVGEAVQDGVTVWEAVRLLDAVLDIEAVTEAVWWRDLPVSGMSGGVWRPLVVLEWPPPLAVRMPLLQPPPSAPAPGCSGTLPTRLPPPARCSWRSSAISRVNAETSSRSLLAPL